MFKAGCRVSCASSRSAPCCAITARFRPPTCCSWARPVPITTIVRTTGQICKLVRNVVRRLTGDVFRSRQSSLEAHLPWLEGEWRAGCWNGAELWRRLRARGFTGSLRVVGEWATRHRRSEQVSDGSPSQVPSVRRLARLLTIARDSLTKADALDQYAHRRGVRGAGERGAAVALCLPEWWPRSLAESCGGRAAAGEMEAALRVAVPLLSAPVVDRTNWTLARLAEKIERQEGVSISRSQLSKVLPRGSFGLAAALLLIPPGGRRRRRSSWRTRPQGDRQPCKCSQTSMLSEMSAIPSAFYF